MATASPILAIVFDLDGTLTAPGHIDFAAMRREIQCPPEVDILSHIKFLEGRSKTAAASAREAVAAQELRALDTLKPSPGLHDTLKGLQNRDIPMAILTRNSREILNITLERLGITPFFARAFAREDAPPKPDPEGIQALCAHMKVPPERALMVGDYIHDIHAGARAGSWTAWLRTAPHGLPPEPSDFEIHQLSDVLSILDGDPRLWGPPHKLSQRSPLF